MWFYDFVEMHKTQHNSLVYAKCGSPIVSNNPKRILVNILNNVGTFPYLIVPCKNTTSIVIKKLFLFQSGLSIFLLEGGYKEIVTSR